jgi:hypothetical protein
VSENEVSEAAVQPEAPHVPEIRVLTGEPTDEELAALAAVLASAGGGVPDPRSSDARRSADIKSASAATGSVHSNGR